MVQGIHALINKKRFKGFNENKTIKLQVLISAGVKTSQLVAFIKTYMLKAVS